MPGPSACIREDSFKEFQDPVNSVVMQCIHQSTNNVNLALDNSLKYFNYCAVKYIIFSSLIIPYVSNNQIPKSKYYKEK